MPSRFGTIFDRLGSPVLTAFLADSAVVQFVAGENAEPVALEGVILGPQATAEETGGEGRRQRITQEITIPRPQNACFATADPVESQTIKIGVVEWYVEAVLRSTAQALDVRLYRGPSIERSQPGYRHR